MSVAPSSPEADPELPRPRDFRFFLCMRFAGTIAIQMQVVGVGWQVYGITGDPVSLGIVALLEFLPMVVLALPAGDLADRIDRRLVLVFTRLIEALASASLVFLTVAGSEAVWHFYLVVVLFGIARGISTPSVQSALPFLVTTERLPKAIAANHSVQTVANVSGPALGGLIYAIDPASTYMTCVVCFLIATFCMYLVRMRQPAAAPRRGTAYQRISDGLSYMWSRPIILGAISLDLFAVLLGGAVALLPVYASDILHVGAEGLGALRSAPAFGAASVALLLARWPLKRHTGSIMFVAVTVFGVAILAFAVSTDFYFSLAALVLTGASDIVSVFVRSTFIQLATPDHMRGRVGAVNSLFISASNELGQFRAGVTAGWFGTVPAVVIGGIGTLAVVGIWIWLFPPLRRVDRFTEIRAD